MDQATSETQAAWTAPASQAIQQKLHSYSNRGIQAVGCTIQGKQMYQITIAAGQAIWSLLFKTEESATKVWDIYTSSVEADPEYRNLTLRDDFGQILRVPKLSSIAALMLEDMNCTKRAIIERSLHQARIQTDVQQAAEADATLRQRRMQQGPAIINPVRFNG